MDDIMNKIIPIISLSFVWIVFSGFWSGDTKHEAQIKRKQQSQETLQLLYNYAPEAKKMLRSSYGYATFTNLGVNLILFSAEGGTGLAHNNKTGKNTYMNMGSGGFGFGLGLKDFRAIFLFANQKAYESFVNSGWEANAQADAAIKLGDDGGAINAAITVAPGVRLYKLTQNGIVLQATIQGTKYWKDGELN